MDERARRVGLDPREYDDRWARLAAAGHDVHGEADCVERLLAELVHPERPARVLDAGCGTGRVAIRLAEQGCRTVGVDLDPALLARARDKAPEGEWVAADLAALAPDEVVGPFDAIVAAGNVMIFVAPGTEARVVDNLAARLTPGRRARVRLPADRPPHARRLRRDGRSRGAVARGARTRPGTASAYAGGDYVVTVDQRPGDEAGVTSAHATSNR